MKQGHSVNQRDIAERGGVSVMTVSRALSGKKGVSAEEAARIRRLAEEMGYVTNPLVSSLMRCRVRKTNPQSGLVLGWYGPDSSLRRRDRGGGKYDTFAEYKAGAMDVCQRRGYRLESLRPWELGINRVSQVVMSRGIQGLIVGPNTRDIKNPASFPEDTPFAVVQVGSSLHNVHHDRVISDSYSGVRLCVRKLREHGYKRIGYIEKEGRLLRTDHLPLAGFLIETLDCERCTYVIDIETEPKIKEFIEREKPDAVIIGDDDFWRRGIAKLKNPPPHVVLERKTLPDHITGIEFLHRDIGAEAAHRLIDHLQGPKILGFHGHSVSIRERWHEGTSHLP